MSIVLYGIPNCDTVRKARGWLEAREMEYAFHDYKKAGIGAGKLRDWVQARGWEALLNRKGPTFRKLPEETRSDLDAERAIGLMMAHTSSIRRPIVEFPAHASPGLLIGFDPHEWSIALAGQQS